MEIQFCNGMYKGRSFAIDTQECVNLYPELEGNLAKGNPILIGTPGTVKINLIDTDSMINVNDINRGLFTTALNRCFAVLGNKLIEIYTDYTFTVRGHLLTYDGMVSIAENESSINSIFTAYQLIICDGSNGYYLDLTTNIFTRITHSDYPLGTHLVSIGGYILQNRKNSEEVYFTTDASTWDASNFFSAEGIADNVLALSVINNELWIFGEKSAEIWWLSGASSTAPFARVNNAFVEIGIHAIRSLGKIGNTIFWLGSNELGHGIVWKCNGYVPERISTHAIEYIISTMTSNQDAVAYCYQEEGHSFYVLTFKEGNRTIVYDMSTGLWHERGIWNSKTGINDRHYGICHCFFNGKNLIGDISNSNIYYYDLDTFTDNGNTIKRIRIGPHIHKDRKRIFFHGFEVDLERGTGLQSGQGDDPQVMMQYSDDGVKWSNELWASSGPVGLRLTRAHWHRLGMARDRIFKVVMSDPVKWIITGAKIEASIEGE